MTATDRCSKSLVQTFGKLTLQLYKHIMFTYTTTDNVLPATHPSHQHPKMSWIHYLVGVSDYDKYGTNCTLIVNVNVIDCMRNANKCSKITNYPTVKKIKKSDPESSSGSISPLPFVSCVMSVPEPQASGLLIVYW